MNPQHPIKATAKLLICLSAAACTRATPGGSEEHPPASTLTEALDTRGAAPAASVPQVEERPSRDNNMGRSFQGRMRFAVERAAQPPKTLTYMSQGNASRVQFDFGSKPVDVLFLGEQLIAYEHGTTSYRAFSLDALNGETGEDKAAEAQPAPKGERRTVQGVVCDDMQIDRADVRVQACVAALPGSVNIDKFEAATGANVPEWLEGLLENEQLPLTASVRSTNGEEQYRVMLEEYSPGPLDAALFAIPSNYKRL
jgi:hypothetical protein